ncbi:response regulator transcription factor [Litchfieldia salsa]|uniref:Branched-chain alpha-ketoacid dehydrogenase kinase n=1 Tax=Litchfieldia salsa TaxID=930152 RepID=A0A1H0VS05_9BACI|nr:response regulator [Litchfieldia salsa]SDP80945.1 branched-chain alpha-ketoacid dehydrogenase kinase [Litchfieldia salsa]
MKAIIIDDEKHVREGLSLLANWNKYGIKTVFEAQDGEEAMKIIAEHHPEIIFTDMRMPKQDGICLLKWLHSSSFVCKTIVISGYDDFDYMRNAIYYKSFDYILKPIDPEILDQTLDRAVNELSQEHQSKTQEMTEGFQAKDTITQKEKSSMQEIEQYLRKNYKQDITLQEIADQFFLSREYISRRFKQEFKETITDYLTRIRIEYAKKLLHNPQMKIYEIAFQIGYHNEKYFSKVFKKSVGVSPNEYRSSVLMS